MTHTDNYNEATLVDLMRHEKYAEAITCAAAIAERLLPLPQPVTGEHIASAASVLLYNCAAHVHLEQYRDARDTAAARLRENSDKKDKMQQDIQAEI
jgi:hypothetical protein